MKQNNIYAIALLLLLIPFSSSLSYSISLAYSDGSFSLTQQPLLTQAQPHSPSAAGEFSAKIISFSGRELFMTKFNAPSTRFYGLPVSNQSVSPAQSQGNFSLTLLLPYFSNAKTLQLTGGSKTLLEVDLGAQATCNENGACDGSESIASCSVDCTCGNGVCSAKENYSSCSLDCPSGTNDGYCDGLQDGKCDGDCSVEKDFDCRQVEKAVEGSASNVFAYTVAALVGLALLVGAFLLNRQGKKK